MRLAASRSSLAFVYTSFMAGPPRRWAALLSTVLRLLPDGLEGSRWAQAGGMAGTGARGSYNTKEAAGGGCERRRGRSEREGDFRCDRACHGRPKCWLHEGVDSWPCGMASTGVEQGAVEAVGVVCGHWPGSALPREGVVCMHVTAP